MSDDELAQVDDGRVFTGRQGLPLKLADAIGGEREAIAWLETEKGVAKNLPVRDWRPDRGWAGVKLSSVAASVADAARPEPDRRSAAARGHALTAAPVDGLVSVWQLSHKIGWVGRYLVVRGRFEGHHL